MRSEKEQKKKKKDKTNSMTSSTNIAKSQPAPRVTNSINIPVRQQIAWAKAYKRLVESSKSPPKTKVINRYKKEKTEKLVQEDYQEIDFEKTKPPAIFVDGYNIIGYMNRIENRNMDLSDARESLVSDLSVLKGATGWDIEVIFDAYNVNGPETRDVVNGVVVTYTSNKETADSLIESRFNDMKLQGYTNMIVATDDSMLRMVAGSNGVGYLPASSLLEELRIAYRGWDILENELIVEDKRNRPKLGDNLNDDIKKAFNDLSKTITIQGNRNRQTDNDIDDFDFI